MHISTRTWPMSRRGMLTAGAATLIGSAGLTVAGLTVANAQATPTPTSIATKSGAFFVTTAEGGDGKLQAQQQRFITSLAGRLGLATDKVQQALQATEQELGPVPLFLSGKPAGGVTISNPLGPAAQAIGISDDQLRQELAGKSLAAVARAHNVDPQQVASALKSARQADIARAQQAGQITAEAVHNLENKLDDMLQMELNLVRPSGAPHGAPGGPAGERGEVLVMAAGPAD